MIATYLVIDVGIVEILRVYRALLSFVQWMIDLGVSR
jgi:hypothetical protein